MSSFDRIRRDGKRSPSLSSHFLSLFLSLSLSLSSIENEETVEENGKQWDSRRREPTYRRNSQFDRGDALGRINSVGVTDKHRVNIDSFNIDGGKCKKRRRANINAQTGEREGRKRKRKRRRPPAPVCTFVFMPFSLLLFDSINVELLPIRLSDRHVFRGAGVLNKRKSKGGRVRCWCRESRRRSFCSERGGERAKRGIQSPVEEVSEDEQTIDLQLFNRAPTVNER